MANARITQEPVEALVLPTTQKARITQEPVEALVLPTTQKARITQVAVQVLLKGAIPAFRAQIID